MMRWCWIVPLLPAHLQQALRVVHDWRTPKKPPPVVHRECFEHREIDLEEAALGWRQIAASFDSVSSHTLPMVHAEHSFFTKHHFP